jgi:acyl carrier protein
MSQVNRENVIRDIYLAMDRANELLDADRRFTHDEETVLFGPEAGLDSLGLVSLILDVELAVNEREGTALILADERAVSRHRNPFRNVGALADFVVARLEEVRICSGAPSC